MRARRISRRSSSSGMTLIELMIAMVVLAVGLIAIANVVALAIANNSRNRLDTTSVMLSEMVLEQIQSVPASANVVPGIPITDCAGVVWNVNTTGAPAPAGAGANLIGAGAANNAGDIDYTQAEAAIPAGYSMDYTTCGPAGQQFVYEVRWNIVTNPANNFTKVVTVSARRKMGALNSSPNLVYFAQPTTLRGIAGS